MQLIYFPLTICAGYYSRDCASRAEGSVRTVTSYHRSGGSSQISFARNRFRHLRRGRVFMRRWGATGCDWRRAQKIAKPRTGCVSRSSTLNWAKAWSVRTRRELIRITSMSSASTCWLRTRPMAALWALIECNQEVRLRANLGYYSEQEFEFAPYEPLRRDILELGRASIDREHRTPEVLTLLWRGIAQYAHDMGLRYLIGCSSLNSKDPGRRLADVSRTRAVPGFAGIRDDADRSLRMSQRAGGCG